ncbi:MAG: hypothetical protein U0793_10725 [Gemmataceae bacterium]
MNSDTERQQNQVAFRRLRDFIRQTYPAGRFVAIGGGAILADAADFPHLDARLQELGHGSTDVLVVQAGVDYPERAVIYI